MNKIKGTIIGSALIGTLAMGNLGIDYEFNNGNFLELQNNIKCLVQKLIMNSDFGELSKIYNPMNPDGIETDDGYIYMVKSKKLLNNQNI